MWIIFVVLAVLFGILFGFVLGKLYVIEHSMPEAAQRLISDVAKQLRRGEVYRFTLSRNDEDEDGGDDDGEGDDCDGGKELVRADKLLRDAVQNWREN